MPRWARWCGFRPLMSRPSNVTAPSMADSSPIRVFIRVDLPTPLRPITAAMVPRSTVNSTPCRTGLSPYPERTPDAASIEPPGFPLARASVIMIDVSKVDLGDGVVGGDLLHRALGKDLAEMEHRHALGYLADEGHVVLDRQHGDAIGVQRADHLARLVGFIGRHAGGR